jgi:hypothetical protein
LPSDRIQIVISIAGKRMRIKPGFARRQIDAML